MYGEIVTRLRYKPSQLEDKVFKVTGHSARLYNDPPEIPFPVLSDYEYCTASLESYEDNKDKIYDVQYELHYKWNNVLYKLDTTISENGTAEFTRLIKGLTYYITAIPLDGKYQSKQMKIVLDEYDIRQEPIALTTYENTDYKNYDHHMILKNVFGEYSVYLDGNPEYISLEKNDKNIRVYLNDENNPDYANFDLVIEDYREEDIIITKKNILVDVPPLPNKNTIFEVPYAILSAKLGKDNIDNILNDNPTIGYIGAIAAKPQKNSQSALLYTKDKNVDYNVSATIEYSDILELKSPINEINDKIEIIGSINNVNNNIIMLNEELMYITDFDESLNVLTVKRGVLDTVPKKHSSGSLFVFDLPDVAFDSTQYAQSEIVEAQVLTTTPSGIQELAVTGMPVEIQARAIRPYPPANVKINGEYFPVEIETDLVITWVDRNRLQETGGAPLSFFEGAVTAEADTLYQLVLIERDENASVLRTQNLSIGAVNTFTFATSAMHVNTRTIQIVLRSLRDGYESYQAFDYTVELSQFFSAPYDLTVEFKDD